MRRAAGAARAGALLVRQGLRAVGEGKCFGCDILLLCFLGVEFDTIHSSNDIPLDAEFATQILLDVLHCFN